MKEKINDWEKNHSHRITKYWMAVIIIISTSILMALVGLFPRACDWYTDHIYGGLSDAISRVTAVFPFALGEIIMYMAILLVLLAIIFLILLIFLGKKEAYLKFCKSYYKTILIILFCFIWIYMPLWFVPFCGTTLGKGSQDLRTEFSNEELYILIDYVVEEGNKAAEEIEIDEDGMVHFPDADVQEKLIEDAMLAISDDYPRLKGYYPPVKEALCSDILNRMDIGGYNYPYTMEPTHNKYMNPIYSSLLDAHELCHHHGYYKENEANFLSQLALIESPDPYLRMAACINTYFYLIDDYKAVSDVNFDEGNGESGTQAPEFSERLWYIYNLGYDVADQVYEADAHPLDKIPEADEAIKEISDKGWEVQGDILEENSYDGVVLLLLQYYDGKLY
ncbi:MAG: DUF3810 domain-containing protein [Eubacterium sp.]|nr:DUF3810 domain-containing protein [Eubacterium sp.]